MTKISKTGQAGVNLLTTFENLCKEHPKGADYVLSKVGPYISALMCTTKEAAIAAASMHANPTVMRDVFDVVSAISWVMVSSPALDPKILMAALEEAQINQDAKDTLWSIFKDCNITRPVWSVINGYMLMGGYDAVEYARCLINEVSLHLGEMAA